MRRIREVMTDRIDLGTRLRDTTTLETSLILGYPHVWRQEEDGGPRTASTSTLWQTPQPAES